MFNRARFNLFLFSVIFTLNFFTIKLKCDEAVDEVVFEEIINDTAASEINNETSSPSHINNETVVFEHSKVWQHVQKIAQDTVVQIFVDTASFNWQEPYKTPKQRKTCGSGFFINAQGLIVTNYHVIDEAAGIKIQIPSLGKEQFKVTVVGVSPDRDIALLKVSNTAFKMIKQRLGRMPYLKLGNSDLVFRAQEIMALGYPLGQEKLKSTQGIVSGREMILDESYIQMTAALNPGNSGGPSLNTAGEVIGINTARVATAQGVGYVIPINDVKNVIQHLLEIKFLRKPILGCEFNYSTKNTTNFLSNPLPGGFYVSRVYKDTLLEKAGVKSGDMIYEINGHKIDMYGEMNVSWSEDKIPVAALLNRFRLDQKIDLIIYRNGEQNNINLKFELSDPLPIRFYYPDYETIDYEIIGGMVIMQLTLNHLEKFSSENPYLVKYLKRQNQYTPRLIITHIFPTSKTQDARVVCESDLIKKVNGQPVNTLEELRNEIKKSENYLSIETSEKQFMVLPFNKIILDEQRLSKKFFYKKTNLIKELLEMRNLKNAES
jgi:serine protease Do